MGKSTAMGELFFDDSQSFQQIESNLWQEFGKALQKGKHPFRYPTLATLSPLGPRQRTLVLRESRAKQKEMVFYTDALSDKMEQLRENSSAALHVYHQRYQMQLRLHGKVGIAKAGENWQKHWLKLPAQRYSEYSIQPAPGAALDGPPPQEYHFNEEQAQERFRLLVFQVKKLEALVLNGERHFRVAYHYYGTGWKARWLTP